MPIIVKGSTYPLPGESGQAGITGRELMTIEANFQVDALQLIGSLASTDEPKPGYTRTKAIYALAWLALHRADAAWTVDRVIDEVAIEDMTFGEDENPTSAA